MLLFNAKCFFLNKILIIDYKFLNACIPFIILQCRGSNVLVIFLSLTKVHVFLLASQFVITNILGSFTLFICFQWVLHDWGDADCIKILKNCKKAIPSRDAGGKVIIVDMVVGGQSSNNKHKETQVLFDLFIMTINGAERDEHEWKKIISEAGFSDYKIIPVLGVRSIIEVYP
jgi:hypothetical protein